MFSQRVTKLIDELETVVGFFFRIKDVSGAKIEKYKQDAPAVTASWNRKAENILRNISLLVAENEHGCFVTFEANAWLDDETTLKRRWAHRSLYTMYVEEYTEIMIAVAVGIALEEIFGDISKVGVEDLVNTSDLRPFPH